MSYEDEKELKRQQKLELKEQKKAEKAAKKAEKASKKADQNAEEAVEEKVDSTENTVESAKEEIKEEVKEAFESVDSDIKTDSNNDVDTTEKTSVDKPAEKPEDSSESNSEDASEDIEEYNPDYKKVKKKKSKDEINIVKELLSLIIYIGIIIIICYCIITFVGQRTTVHGHSMETTLQDGDNLWIDKFTYHFSEPKRFDVIVFPYQGQDVFYIKRIIGLPGETVQITPEGNILINDEILSESYGREIILDSGTASEPRTLGENEYFVLGDNRNDSRDSRWADVGNINKKDIIGKAVLRISPFSKFGKID
jgi:signal peptidase I